MVNNNLSNTNDEMNTLSGSYAALRGNAMQSGAQGMNSDADNTVVGVFNSRSDAEKAVSALRSQGFTSEEINIISKRDENEDDGDGFYDDDVSDGALTGGAIGGLGGLLLGAGALAIPGIGPIVAAGPIAAAIGGAMTGGIAGGLIDWGIPAEAGERYEQHVAQGGILTIIRTNKNKVQQAAQILRQYDAQDVESHQGR
jgi:hypothetical protein